MHIQLMAQSQGYKRFLSSINNNHYGTSTPQTRKDKTYPRSSTPNTHSIPVLPSTIIHYRKIQKNRYYSTHPRVYINRIILIPHEKSCYCKKNILGIF